jgi:hypothetical protein
MFEMLKERLMPVLSAANARRMGRAGLHQPCLIILTGLVIQLALGMILNLYIAIPAAGAQTSYLREIETAPGMLTAHALVALLVLATAGILLQRAVALRDMAVIAPVAAGFASLLGAFAAGEVFVRNDESSASLSMAILTDAALLCYIYLQAIIIWQRPAAREGAVGQGRLAGAGRHRQGDQDEAGRHRPEGQPDRRLEVFAGPEVNGPALNQSSAGMEQARPGAGSPLVDGSAEQVAHATGEGQAERRLLPRAGRRCRQPGAEGTSAGESDQEGFAARRRPGRKRRYAAL